MSIPRNHHYVSQVLSEKFVSRDGYIHIYNKYFKYNKFRSKTSTKSTFSQKDLNLRKERDGKLDYSSVELILNKNFETDFNKHYQLINEAIKTPKKAGEALSNSDQILNSIKYLMGMALIGQSRHPDRIEQRNNEIFGPLFDLDPTIFKDLRSEISTFYSHVADIANKTPIDFKKLHEGIVKSMGEVVYSILLAPKNEYFILPDCTAAQRRFGFKPDIIDGKEYFNEANPIGTAIMPINSKVLLAVTAKRLIPEEFEKEDHQIFTLNNELVRDFNITLYNDSFREVACENKKYLVNFIEKISVR